MQRGCRKSARQYYQLLIAQQRKSGLSISQFCTRNHISTWCFYYWNKRLSMMPDTIAKESNRETLQKFIPVTVAQTPATVGPEVVAEIIIADSLRIKVPSNYPAEGIRAFFEAAGYWGGNR